MNPLDLVDAIRELKRNLYPNHQTVVNSSMVNASTTNNDWDTFCKYSRYTVDKPQSSMGVNEGSKGLSPPSHNFCIEESEVEDPDGEAFEMDEEDPELQRKRNELREIEEQIMRKKVAIALKKAEFVKDASPPGSPCNEQSAKCRGTTLKDRVNTILQQQHPVDFLLKVQSSRDRMDPSSLSKHSLLQEDHPLKLRVKALMKQRCDNTCFLHTNREVPDVTPPPLRTPVSSPAKEENSINPGFQRFLSVLNKGVDMDLLSRIVNDDSEDLPLGEELLNIQPPALESKSDLPFRSTSQRSNSGASLPGHSRASSGERKTDSPSQERSLTDQLPADDGKKNDRGDFILGSSSPSKSPRAVKRKKKKKVEEEEEEKPKVDEQHVQLKNILKSLGLSLEVEEMSKLADRTQERLYGKKHEGQRADSRGEQESRQRSSHRHHRNSSSSSSSCSTSSRSTSRSYSPSPSDRRHSDRRDSKQRQPSEHSGSRDRSRDSLTCQDGKEDSKEAQSPRDGDKDSKDSEESSTYQHPYPQNQTYLHPHPAAFSTFPHYSLSPYSNHDTYEAAANSYWTCTQGAIPLSLYTSGHSYPQNMYNDFPCSVVAPNMVYRCHKPREDLDLIVNPDLSKSEGQVGSPSGPRCLQVISTKPATRSCLKQLTKGLRRRGNLETRKKKHRLRKKQKLAAKWSTDSVVKVEAPQGDEDESDSEAEQSEEEKQQPTEEEIKANLRKKLEAFNQKVKQKLTEPATSLSSQVG